MKRLLLIVAGLLLLIGCDGPAKPAETDEEKVKLNRAANKLAQPFFEGRRLENAEGWVILLMPSDGTKERYLHLVAPGTAQAHFNHEWFKLRGITVRVVSGKMTQMHAVMSDGNIIALLEELTSGRVMGYPVLFTAGEAVGPCRSGYPQRKEDHNAKTARS